MISHSELETLKYAESLADQLFQSKPCFIQLSGLLGAGKTTFSRGFINRWLTLSGESPTQIISPTFNIIKIYGKNHPVAHLDLYRVKNLDELEQLDFEQYFYQMPCCLVEWLDQIPEAIGLKPSYAVHVEISFDIEQAGARIINISRLSTD